MPNQINQLANYPLPGDTDPGWALHYSQLTQAVNALLGYSGPVPIQNHINLNGNRIQNLGPAVEATDALTSGAAESSYSAAALAPQLESTGSQPLKTVRRVNDPNQREQSSSFINDLMSATPNANTILPVLTNVGGGVQVTIPTTKFTFADGSSIMLISRTDVLSFPASYAITSISCTGDVVTAVLASAPSLVAGNAATVDGVTPSAFNGTWALTSVVGTTIRWQESLGSVTGSGGTLYVNGVYYYAAKKRSNNIYLLGAFSGDTAQNRLQANFDGFQIIAVVVVTASGGQVAQSGGGGSAIVGSPTAGSFF